MIRFLILVMIAIVLSYLSQTKNRDIYLYAGFLVLAFLMGFQDSISVDFPNYLEDFDLIQNGRIKGAIIRTQENRGVATEMGWYLLNKAIGTIIPSFYAVSFVACGFFCISVALLIKEVFPSRYRWVATTYFAFSPMLFFMSGLRQTIAVGCFIFAVRALLNKKKWHVPILWLLAGALFHNSLVVGSVFLLLLLIPDRIKNVYVVALSALFVVALFFGERYKTELLLFSTTYFSDSLDQYAHYLLEDESMTYSIRSIIRLAFPFLFTVIPMSRARGKDFYFLLFFAVGQILYALLGFTGNLQRITLYMTIFAVASFMVSSNLIKSKLVNVVFIGGNLLLNIYLFYVLLSNEQYVNFLQYKTIFSVF